MMDLQPSSRQRELIARARHLARERFAERADRHDRDAAFPFEDYADLRAEGFLGLCVPERYGGLGAGYQTYCLVSEQLAQGNASTALTFNMHCLTMLMMGPIADNMAMPTGQRERHETLRAVKFREVMEDGAVYGQPHSEPRHGAPGRVHPRRRGGADAWPVRGHVQCLPPPLPELLRDLPRAHASGLRRRPRLSDRSDAGRADPAYRDRREGSGDSRDA